MLINIINSFKKLNSKDNMLFKIHNLYFGLIGLFIPLSSFCQDSTVIHGIVKEKFEDHLIQNASIEIKEKNTTFFSTTSQKGEFWMKLPQQKEYELNVTHSIYNDLRRIINSSSLDTIEVLIEMSPIKVLKDVVIKGKIKPEVVFGDTLLSVADFEVLNNGKIILLTYPKRLIKGSEILLWDESSVLSRTKVIGIAEELVRDFRGNVHVICTENVYGINCTENEMKISSIEKEYFKKYLQPILDTNKSKMYLSNFSKDYPEFKYFSFDQLDSTYVKIIKITDDLMMELYRSEYKWVDVRTKLWAKQKEQETGIDAVIWVGANYFTQSIYYKQLYAPMFHRSDTLFVFDYYKDLLWQFNETGDKIDSIPIFHHYHPKTTGWKKKLIQDQITGQVYAVFEIAGYTYISYIDTKTGKLGDRFRIGYRYVEKIEIHNNSVYYVYRPFESSQKKFLYKEKLPYYFEKSDVYNN